MLLKQTVLGGSANLTKILLLEVSAEGGENTMGGRHKDGSYFAPICWQKVRSGFMEQTFSSVDRLLLFNVFLFTLWEDVIGATTVVIVDV